MEWFRSREEAKVIIEAWRRHYWSLLTSASPIERLAAVRALDAKFPEVS